MLSSTAAFFQHCHHHKADSAVSAQLHLVAQENGLDIESITTAAQTSWQRLVLTTPELQTVLDGTNLCAATTEDILALKVSRDDEVDGLLDRLLTIRFKQTPDELPMQLTITKASSDEIIFSLTMLHTLTDGDSLYTMLHQILLNLGNKDELPERAPWKAPLRPSDFGQAPSTWEQIVGFLGNIKNFIVYKARGCWKGFAGEEDALISKLLSEPESLPWHTATASLSPTEVARLRVISKAKNVSMTTMINSAAVVAAMKLFDAKRVGVVTAINLRLHLLPKAPLGCYAVPTAMTTISTDDFWSIVDESNWLVEPKYLRHAMGLAFFLRHLDAVKLLGPVSDLVTGRCLASSMTTSNMGAPRHFNRSYFINQKSYRLTKTQFFYGGFVPFLGVSTWDNMHLTLTSRESNFTKDNNQRWLNEICSILAGVASNIKTPLDSRVASAA